MLLPANVTLKDSIKQSSNQGRVDLAQFVNAPCPSKLLIAVLPSSTTSTVSSFDRPQVIAVHSSHFQHSVFSVFFPNLWTFFVPFLGTNRETLEQSKDIHKVLNLTLSVFSSYSSFNSSCLANKNGFHVKATVNAMTYHTITIAIAALIIITIVWRSSRVQSCPQPLTLFPLNSHRPSSITADHHSSSKQWWCWCWFLIVYFQCIRKYKDYTFDYDDMAG